MNSVLYIGAIFSINSIRYSDGQTAFAEAPYVVLRNESLGKYLGKTATAVEGSRVYTVTFEKTETVKLSEGKYILEVYASSAMNVMLKRWPTPIEAKYAAASGSTHNQTPFS